MASDAKTVQERRRELLRRRIAESGAAVKVPAADEPVLKAGERYGLSSGQRRMWFVQAMDTADTTLNISVAYRLTGALDPERLRNALSDVIARHTVLRSTYGLDAEGEPYQTFQESVEIPWQVDDLTKLGPGELNQQVETTAHQEFGRPFDLTSELPMRVRLLRTGAAEFVLLLVVHHICWDDDSWAVFFEELETAYNGGTMNPAAPQYVAVEVLGRAATEGRDAQSADIDYWRESLSPLPDPLELPGSSVANPSKNAQRRASAVPAEISARLETFARNRSATPFMVLLAAYGALIRRYAGAADFLVSIPVTERRGVAVRAIGYFGNTLLLRIRVRSEDTFTSLVDSVRETCLQAFARQSVGLDRVVREVNPERSSGRDGMDHLVRLGFSMRKTATGLRLNGVTTRQLDLGAVTAPVPLALAIVLDPEGMSTEFEYQTEVLSSALVDQMLSHYVQLLDRALDTPAHRIAALDLLGPGERAAVLAQSHGELVATPASTIVAALESAAAAAPEALALVSDDVQLTYAELHGRANRLARWLIGNGIGTEDIVGLRMTTSVEFIVAMFAVLKAGAAYLPIDPAFPEDRIDYLVSDAGPKIVIGQQELIAAEGTATLLSDAVVTDADRLRPLHPEHLAYVIYTSGSTGQPKGVAVPHHAIAEHMDGFVAEWSLTASDRVFQSSSVSFDASLMEIFAPLSLGACLIVPKPNAFNDIPYVADVVGRHGVTTLHMVPSMLSTLLLLPEVNEWRQLRHVPVGGEALSGEVADKFAGYFDATLRNHYGPTEAVICATHMSVEGPQGTGVVPIGVANRNVYTYVLDQELQPVPAEVVGELYLGGNQLARGYLGRPALTAQRFVADPFNPGMRLYRTGDLVRRNVTGKLEFVGRADEQVKVRGFRIELGEVESVIALHPKVRHCLVVAEETEIGPRLVGYVVPVAGNDIELSEIHAHAASVLPEYLVPSAFGVISEIPLTVHGKLDKRALPEPTAVTTRSYREPATDGEHRMCAIFGRLFGLEQVGADDSFFDLGGHSLLAARLVAQIRAEFDVDCNVRAVFDAPTPAGLATLLAEQSGTGRPGLVDVVRPDRPPLSYSQLAMWFQHRMRGANDVFNLALSLRFTGPLDTTALEAALNDVVARHEALRTAFAEHEGMPYQRVQPALTLDLAVVETTAEQLDQQVTELRRFLFDLESGPLIRPTLIVLGPDTHVLIVLIHHIVTDHNSLGVIYEDLLSAYRARLAGAAPTWDPLPFQFIDYALWQRNTFDVPNEWALGELNYWCNALAGLPTEIALGADRARPPVIGRRAAVATFAVPAARRVVLTRLADEHGASEFMVYQAALAVLLHKIGGGTDVAVGSPVAARGELAVTQVNGPFANVVTLRNDLSDDPSLRTTLTRCREVVLDALAHQELPIDRLVDALNPPRSRSRNHPFFQSSIHFRAEDWATAPRDLTPETTVVPIPMEFEVSLLDLNVSVSAMPDENLDVRIVANADLYEPETVQHIADALDAALEAFAVTPDSALSTLQLAPAAVMVKLLAPPTPAGASPAQPEVCGSAETQQALIALLEELLEISDVEPDDNFFALGGDSIIAVQMSARANAQGLALAPAMVFEHMTIAEVAAAVDAANDAAGAPDSRSEQQLSATSAPMSASGLDADALAALTASWQSQS
ncbi:non-ribosomal peptide synthetase [Mycobacterium asiaticum]|uniref:Non-ribosomal peptide synthetase n=1 Tax=Mycobacterium asiaticum TaxID=1790 RepID=A0A1A3NCD3_MYCAS|nr:non-ribosomal peptide synthetase [Mycobacterium asiaticum]OBK19441.1 non-ribosomal peptide synthetase [Mycobacterium asiaticum]